MNLIKRLSAKNDISIHLQDQPRLQTKNKEPIFYHGELIQGQVVINSSLVNFTHGGVELELVISTESQCISKFQTTLCSVILLEPGVISRPIDLNFELDTASAKSETYSGKLGKIIYFLRLSIFQKVKDIVKTLPVAIHVTSEETEQHEISFTVCLTDAMDVELRFNSLNLDVNELLFGTLLFKYYTTRIARVNLEFWKKEIVDVDDNYHEHSELVYYITVIEGCPAIDIEIPFRFLLGGLDLCPSMEYDMVYVSVNYYFVIAMYDDEGRRYFKNKAVSLNRSCKERKTNPLMQSIRQQAVGAFSSFIMTPRGI